MAITVYAKNGTPIILAVYVEPAPFPAPGGRSGRHAPEVIAHERNAAATFRLGGVAGFVDGPAATTEDIASAP